MYKCAHRSMSNCIMGYHSSLKRKEKMLLLFVDSLKIVSLLIKKNLCIFTDMTSIL